MAEAEGEQDAERGITCGPEFNFSIFSIHSLALLFMKETKSPATFREQGGRNFGSVYSRSRCSQVRQISVRSGCLITKTWI